MTQAVPVLLFLALWEAVTLSALVPREILPSVHAIAGRCLTLLTSGDLVPHLLGSVGRAATGFVLATGSGVALGALMSRSPLVNGFVSPLLALSYPIPKPAFFPLFLIWLGLGSPTHVAVIFSGCIIPVVISTFNGSNRVNRHLVWTAQNLGMSRRRILFRVVLPAALPDIVVGIRVALTLAFVMLVSSEMLAGQNGLGFLAAYLGEAGDFEGMFAVVLFIGLLGFTADQVYSRITGRLLDPYHD
jgi:NitT/TauT family transport system permease protein